MAGFSITEKKIDGGHKSKTSVCGSCGEPVAKGRLLCDECVGFRWMELPYNDEAHRD